MQDGYYRRPLAFLIIRSAGAVGSGKLHVAFLSDEKPVFCGLWVDSMWGRVDNAIGSGCRESVLRCFGVLF